MVDNTSKTKNPLDALASNANTKVTSRLEIEDTESCPVCHDGMETVLADGNICKVCLKDRVALPIANSKI